MAYDDSKLCTQIQHWAEQSVEQGWLDKSQAASLLTEPRESANALFNDGIDRPLVVAFLGGTGVGKSSLLNKLAGQSIATAGMERPTSREVTLYHHQSVAINLLEKKFPLQQIKVAQHANSANEKIIWIDMPDFDSTEDKNKAIVMQWLPFIDVLVYVVSPERYRDNKAWQLLLSEGANHAWLFALNQWDRGDSLQFDDFKQQLAKAGFNNPLIYKTSCVGSVEDELENLQATIQSLGNDKTVEHLEQRGQQQRRDNIKNNCQQCLLQLGNEKMFSRLLAYQVNTWVQTKLVLKEGFEWPIKQAALNYSETGNINKKQPLMLWDDWAKSRFNDYLDDLILTANQSGLPSKPLRKQLAIVRNKAEQTVNIQAEMACRKALVNPGNTVQRGVLKMAHISEIILPLITMSIVGIEVFEGYYDSSLTNEGFLGVNFVVHSLLLILISGLFPYFITKKMQPSLEKTALKGLDNGLNIALSTMEIDVAEAINNLKQQQQERISTLKYLILESEGHDENRNDQLKNEALEKMLLKTVTRDKYSGT